MKTFRGYALDIQSIENTPNFLQRLQARKRDHTKFGHASAVPSRAVAFVGRAM